MCGAFYSRVLLLEEEVWAHYITLAPPPFILMPVLSLESERSSIYVPEVSILTVAKIYDYRIRVKFMVLNATFSLSFMIIFWNLHCFFSLLLLDRVPCHQENVDAVLRNTIFVEVSGGTFCDRSLVSIRGRPLFADIFPIFLFH